MGMNIPLISSFALLSFVGFSANLQGLGWTMAAITAMLIITVYNTFLIINPDRREIQSKTGFAGSKIIPFDKLQGFKPNISLLQSMCALLRIISMTEEKRRKLV